jgi:adenosylcobinamide kinase/adenosylcobinamide-phosphate guanylyltransferase
LPHRTLVLGGIRSGKSEWAERQLGGDPVVRYVAPDPGRPDDADWSARVAAHRARRPTRWATVETLDVAGELRAAAPGTSLLVDELGGWLTAVLDRAGEWWAEDGSADVVAKVASEAVTELVAAWTAYTGRAVLVSAEVGLSLVPGSASGRRFADLLGSANRALSEVSDEVVLVVAGRPLGLHGEPS